MLRTIGEASSPVIITRLFNFFRVRACQRARARVCRQEVGGSESARRSPETESADSASARGEVEVEVEVAHLHHRLPPARRRSRLPLRTS